MKTIYRLISAQWKSWYRTSLLRVLAVHIKSWQRANKTTAKVMFWTIMAIGVPTLIGLALDLTYGTRLCCTTENKPILISVVVVVWAMIGFGVFDTYRHRRPKGLASPAPLPETEVTVRHGRKTGFAMKTTAVMLAVMLAVPTATRAESEIEERGLFAWACVIIVGLGLGYGVYRCAKVLDKPKPTNAPPVEEFSLELPAPAPDVELGTLDGVLNLESPAPPPPLPDKNQCSCEKGPPLGPGDRLPLNWFSLACKLSFGKNGELVELRLYQVTYIELSQEDIEPVHEPITVAIEATDDISAVGAPANPPHPVWTEVYRQTLLTGQEPELWYSDPSNHDGLPSPQKFFRARKVEEPAVGQQP